MAGIRQGSVGLLLAALWIAFTAAGVAAGAQSTNSSGSIAGKLTDLHSVPLDGATVVLRNGVTGSEARTITGRNGSYRFTDIEAGEYTLKADSPRLGKGQLEGILVTAGHETRLQTAIEFQLPPVVYATPLVAALNTIETVTPIIAAPVSARSLEQLSLESRPLAQPAVPDAVAAPSSATSIPHSNKGLVLKSDELSPHARPSAETIETKMALGAKRGSGVPAPAVSELAPFALDSLDLRAPAAPGLMFGGFGLGLSETAARLGVAAVESGSPHPAAAREVARAANPATAAVTTVLTAEQLDQLPVSGRRWQDFALDVPAAATAADSSATSLRGAGPDFDTTVDGATTRLAFGRSSETGSAQRQEEGDAVQSAGMAQPWAGGRGFAVGESSIREVQTFAGNAEADGARAAGGRVSVETERGENGLHGQGFLFDRQNVWGAQNPFTQWVKETVPATTTTSPVFTPEPYTPPDHETTWGFGLGSQIRRDKLFWFAALDGDRRNDPGLATVKHPDVFFAQPSNDQMQVLAARLGLSSVNPVVEGLERYSTLLQALAGLLGPAPRTATQWVGFGRMDWQPAERHRLTLETIGADWNSPGGGLTRLSETYGSNSFGVSEASEERLLGRWEAFITPNLLAVTQVSAGRGIQSARAETPSAFEQSFLQPSVWGQLPQIVVDNRYGFTIGNPSRFGSGSYPDERIDQGQINVNWAHRSLLVTTGFYLSHNADETGLLRNQTGTYSYSTVQNFVSDALAFGQFGIAGQGNLDNPHNCDATGKVWRDTAGQLRGLGYLPCYSYYSQVIGPAHWNLSTNDWAGYVTAQWQAKKLLVFSAGLRWEREQLPPPIAHLANPGLPLTESLPSLGDNWGPRVGMALGSAESRWPVLRLGYGLYFGRTANAAIETALTQTGSANGDLNFFLRPTDNLNAGGAPPFPYVLAGKPSSEVKPGVVEFASSFRNPEIHQAVLGLEESLPGHVMVTTSAMMSLGRLLPVSIDTNFDPAVNPGTITYGVVDGSGAGPIKATQITVPFYASWPSSMSATGSAGRLNPDYQQITQIMSRANSTYEAAALKIARNSRRGLSLDAHYTYSHAADWNPNESATVAGSDVLDPAHFNMEYGTSGLDVRHSASIMAIYQAPWNLYGLIGRAANQWTLSAVGSFRSGLPFTMRTSGSLTEEFNATTGAAIVALGPGMNGSGGDNRVYGVGRNTYRYPAAWKADLRLAKGFDLERMQKLELFVESFNLFNHQNVTELETTGYSIEPGSLSGAWPTLNFLTGVKADTTAFGQPLNINATNFYRERQIQFGVRVRY